MLLLSTPRPAAPVSRVQRGARRSVRRSGAAQSPAGERCAPLLALWIPETISLLQAIDKYLSEPREDRGPAEKRRRPEATTDHGVSSAGDGVSSAGDGVSSAGDGDGDDDGDAESGSESDGDEGGLESAHLRRMAGAGTGAGAGGEDEDDAAAPLPVKTMAGEVVRLPRMTSRARAVLARASDVAVEGVTVVEDERMARVQEQMAKDEERKR